MPDVGKDKDADLGFARLDQEQIKETRLSKIMTLSKGFGLLNSLL